MDGAIKRSKITVAVEKCQLCCYTRRPMICFNCIQSGNFSHSSDEFIAENYYLNKRKLWIKKKKETKELKDRLNECIKKDSRRKAKLLKIQKSRVNIEITKEAYNKLNEEFQQDYQCFEESKATNMSTSREIATIKTKIRNIVEHLKKQPEKQETSVGRMERCKKELADCRKSLSIELVQKIFPISFANESCPVSEQREISEEKLKQISIYLSKNTLQCISPSHNPQITSILGASLNASNVTLTDSQSQGTLTKLHLPHQHLQTPSLTTSSSDPNILPSFTNPKHSPHSYKTFINPPINTSTNPPTNSSTNPITDSTTNPSSNPLTNPPNIPPTKSLSHSKYPPSSFQLLNTSAINLLKEARMTAFINGRWVYSTDFEDGSLQIMHACLPANMKLLLKKEQQSTASDIKAGLSLLTQLTCLLSHILDFSLPKNLHFKEFSGELTVRQLKRCLGKLDTNVRSLCHYENLPLTRQSSHPLQNIHCLVMSPLLGCDEAQTSYLLKSIVEEECTWTIDDSTAEDRSENYEGEEEGDEEEDEEKEDNATMLKERLSKFPQRLRRCSCPPNSSSSSEGNWEYISPHVELIPEDSQQLSSTSSLSSSETIGASVGAYLSSWIHALRS